MKIKECCWLTLLISLLPLGPSVLAQDPCKPGELARGDKCVPASSSSATKTRSPKICSLSVQVNKDPNIQNVVKGVTLSLSVTDPKCREKSREKGRKKSLYDYSPTPKTASSGEQITFSKLDCSCNYNLNAYSTGYLFKEGSSRAAANIKDNNSYTFTLIPPPEPPKPPPPKPLCNNSTAPEPISLDAKPESYQITAESNCKDVVEGKQYYKDHSLITDVRGYKIEVRLESENAEFLGFELLPGQGEPLCSPVSPARLNQRFWQCHLPNKQQYLFRVFNKDPGSAPDLSYKISLESLELTKEGYEDWMENILNGLGKTPGPNVSPVINALSHQIDLSNEVKLRPAGESLEKLEDLTKTASYDKSLTSTLLAMIYRYHRKDFIKAREKETAAIEQGASVRFRVMIGTEKDLKQFSRYWLSIGRRGISFEPLGDSENDKSSELNRKIQMAAGTALETPEFKVVSKGKLPIQCVTIKIERKTYYIVPLSYDQVSHDRDEANTIKKHIENAKK